MADNVERIVFEDKRCCDNNRGGMSAGDIMAIMSGQKQMDPAALMAMMQNGKNSGDNWWWIILLFLFAGNGFGGFGGNRNGQGVAGQLNTDANTNLLMQAINGNKDAIGNISTMMNCDVNRITDGLCSIKSAVDSITPQIGWSSEKVINAIAQGNNGILSKMCECCCQTQGAIKDGVASISNQLCGMNNTISRGFADLGFLSERNTNAIIQANNAQTQRILDKMCEDEKQSLRDRLFEQNQSTQTLQILAAVQEIGKCCPTTSLADLVAKATGK